MLAPEEIQQTQLAYLQRKSINPISGEESVRRSRREIADAKATDDFAVSLRCSIES